MSAGSSGTSSGSTAQDGSLSAQAGPRPRDGPAGQYLRATVAGPARGAAGPDRPDYAPFCIRSITPPGGVVGAAPSVEVLAGSAKPPPAPTLTSWLEGGLEVVVAKAVFSPFRRGSG